MHGGFPAFILPGRLFIPVEGEIVAICMARGLLCSLLYQFTKLFTMKKIQKLIMLSLLFSASFTTACHKSGNNNASTLTPGAWKITYFFSQQDETSNYQGYVFDFESNGGLSASKGVQIWQGAWSAGLDDSQDKLLIAFSGGAPSALLELQEDWHIIKMDDGFMHLEHTSGGNGHTEVLHFERN